MANWKVQEKMESVFDTGYKHFGNRGTYNTRSPAVEGSDHLSRLSLNGKLWMLSDDDDDQVLVGKKVNRHPYLDTILTYSQNLMCTNKDRMICHSWLANHSLGNTFLN